MSKIPSGHPDALGPIMAGVPNKLRAARMLKHDVATKHGAVETAARGLMTICERVFRDLKFQLPGSRVKKFPVATKLVESPATGMRRLLAGHK